MNQVLKDNFFQKGWRPTLCWSLVFSLIIQWTLKPLLSNVWPIEAIPDAGITAIVALLASFGTMRTVEKIKGKIKSNE